MVSLVFIGGERPGFVALWEPTSADRYTVSSTPECTRSSDNNLNGP